MSNKDMILTCQKCRSRFYFTVGEQNFYKQKGLNIPKYCKNCRNCRKQKKNQQVREWVAKACSTCYFFGDEKPFIDTQVFPLEPGEYRPCKTIWLNVCSRSNRPIINDRPCKYWTKG